MRISHVFVAVVAVALTSAPAFAETYRDGDAAPAMEQVASPQALRGTTVYGFGATDLGVSPRNDRDGDAAPVSRVVNPGSVSRTGNFGITSPEAGKHGHFTSPRFE